MGDGVLVYFGYPQAHEDDAERAVRAGLALIEAVGKLSIQEALQVRIGVATAWSSWAILLVRGRPRNAGSWVKRQICRRACRASRSRNGCHRRGHATASRRPLRTAGPRAEVPPGHCRVGAGGAAGEVNREPLRGAARDRPDSPRRAERRMRTAVAALGQGKDR